MRACLISLAAAIAISLAAIRPCFANIQQPEDMPSTSITHLELPSALSEDDSFEDLPFEQLRQALREEVERGPKRGPSPRSFKKYNFFLR